MKLMTNNWPKKLFTSALYIQLIKEYSKYDYNATFSYGEGKAYVESNHPYFIIYIEYQGDGFITPNTKDIKMQVKSKPNVMFFKLLSFTNPASHLFDYFGTIQITKAKIYHISSDIILDNLYYNYFKFNLIFIFFRVNY